MTLRIGLIGCGKWGRNILRDLVSLGATVDVVAPSEQSRATACELGAASAVADINALTSAPDGFVIATPTNTHADMIDRLLPTGRPLFVEKPMTNDAARARRIAAAGGSRVFVMDKWRYHPAVETLAALARSGELGEIQAIRSFRLGWGNPHDDTDAIWHLLPHDLSMVLEILGYLPAARCAWVGNVRRQSDDFLGVLQDETDGPRATVEIATSHPAVRRSIVVIGSRGSAQLPDTYSDHIARAQGVPGAEHDRPYQQAVSTEMPLLKELRAFLDHLQGGPPPRSSAAEGVQIIERIAALRTLAGLD